ncbi:MAG: hypothetical protein JW854_16965 [Actinobacteria bacterium]|nr:hypothetical protein [Actinomycetota bacterium]
MKKIKVCAACGVPREISEGSRWESDGTISALRTPGQRSLFYEVEGIDSLFRNIGEIVGQPVNRIVAEGKRKNTLDFLEGYFSGLMGMLARTIGRRRIYMTIADLGAAFGYGHFKIMDVKRGEYVKVFGRNIYSLPLLTGDLLATFNFTERLPASVIVEEKEGGQIITIKQGEKPEEELSSRLEPVLVVPKPGDIHFDTCASCGAPIDLKSWDFDVEAGVITDNTTGRRMASMGIDQVDAVLRELQEELGEEIIAFILQAQRDYIKSNLGADEIGGGYSYLRHFFALRGMGNLVSYEFDGSRLEAIIENARPPLLVAGVMYGVFESLSSVAGKLDYSLLDDGTLEIKVMAA